MSEDRADLFRLLLIERHLAKAPGRRPFLALPDRPGDLSPAYVFLDLGCADRVRHFAAVNNRRELHGLVEITRRLLRPQRRCLPRSKFRHVEKVFACLGQSHFSLVIIIFLFHFRSALIPILTMAIARGRIVHSDILPEGQLEHHVSRRLGAGHRGSG